MKNNLIEEIQRYKQLSTYNPKFTLTENEISETSTEVRSLELALGKDIETLFKENNFGTAIQNVKELQKILNTTDKDFVSRVRKAVADDGNIVGGPLAKEFERAGIFRDLIKQQKTLGRSLEGAEAKTIADQSIKNFKKLESQVAKELGSSAESSSRSAATGARDINVKGGAQTINFNPVINVTTSGREVAMEGKGVVVPAAEQTIKEGTPLATRVRNMIKGKYGFWKIAKKLAVYGIPAYALWWYIFKYKPKRIPDDTPPIQPKPDDNGGGGTTTTTPQGNYTQCDETFPIEQYCKNNTIAKIQTCLGIVADGKFGPKTQAALEAKGLPGTEITQDSLNRACQSSSNDGAQKPKDASYYDDYQTDELETPTTNTPNYDDYSPVEGEDETTPSTNTTPTTTTQSTNSPTPNKKMFYPNPEEEYQ